MAFSKSAEEILAADMEERFKELDRISTPINLTHSQLILIVALLNQSSPFSEYDDDLQDSDPRELNQAIRDSLPNFQNPNKRKPLDDRFYSKIARK